MQSPIVTPQSIERAELLKLLREKSVQHGEFILRSGAKSTVYVNCKTTTMDPLGAALVGRTMFRLISSTCDDLDVKPDCIGGLTMGADPISLVTAMESARRGWRTLQALAIRKERKDHGKDNLIEGNFKVGDQVVVIDDVCTKGDSTFMAIQAIEEAGGKVVLVAALVDREEGGSERIQAKYPFVSVFNRSEVFDK